MEQFDIDNDWAYQYFQNYLKEQQEKYNIVSSQDYIDWIDDFMARLGITGFSDDDYLYKKDSLSQRDYNYASLLSWFKGYVQELAETQGVKGYEDHECGFENINYYILINDKCYLISTCWGQGSFTHIELLSSLPEHKCVIVCPSTCLRKNAE